jgi:hypothetical protein
MVIDDGIMFWGRPFSFSLYMIGYGFGFGWHGIHTRLGVLGFDLGHLVVELRAASALRDESYVFTRGSIAVTSRNEIEHHQESSDLTIHYFDSGYPVSFNLLLILNISAGPLGSCPGVPSPHSSEGLSQPPLNNSPIGAPSQPHSYPNGCHADRECHKLICRASACSKGCSYPLRDSVVRERWCSCGGTA